MKKVVCYTCCTGGYDSFLEHTVVNPDWDYIYFTDNKELIAQKNLECGQSDLLNIGNLHL